MYRERISFEQLPGLFALITLKQTIRLIVALYQRRPEVMYLGSVGEFVGLSVVAFDSFERSLGN